MYDGSGQVVTVKAELALLGLGTGGDDKITVNFQPWLYSTDFAVEFPRTLLFISSYGHLHLEHNQTVINGPAIVLGQYNELEARLDFVHQKTA